MSRIVFAAPIESETGRIPRSKHHTHANISMCIYIHNARTPFPPNTSSSVLCDPASECVAGFTKKPCRCCCCCCCSKLRCHRMCHRHSAQHNTNTHTNESLRVGREFVYNIQYTYRCVAHTLQYNLQTLVIINIHRSAPHRMREPHSKLWDRAGRNETLHFTMFGRSASWFIDSGPQ